MCKPIYYWMIDFTLNDLMDFTQKENEMVQAILHPSRNEQAEPDDQVLRNIISYSKAISVRKSRHLRTIRTVLN
jgi:phage-related protein